MKNLEVIYTKTKFFNHYSELEKDIEYPATLEEGIQRIYKADKFICNCTRQICETSHTDKAKANEMFKVFIDTCIALLHYEIRVKEMIIDAIASGEEVYLPVIGFDGQISNLGNIRKISDNSIVEKYCIDGVEVFHLDRICGEWICAKGGRTIIFQNCFDCLLYAFSKGRGLFDIWWQDDESLFNDDTPDGIANCQRLYEGFLYGIAKCRWLEEEKDYEYHGIEDKKKEFEEFLYFLLDLNDAA